MQLQITSLQGPEFLDAVADAELSQGLLCNHGPYRDNGLLWRADRTRIEELERENAALRDQLAGKRALTTADKPRFRV
jgi:hypothetical protein